jgi:putative hydrolase of the HAD superfamily
MERDRYQEMKALMEFQKWAAVSFDVGGTLIRPHPSVGHVYAEVAARFGAPHLSPDVLNDRFAHAWKSFTGFDYTRIHWEKVVDHTFAGLIPSSTALFPALYERFGQADAWHVFDDVRPTLDLLKSFGVRLAIISNWDERLRGLLQELELQSYFETCVISCEVGVTKPSPALFHQAAQRMGIPLRSLLHVGDSDELDRKAAHAAGAMGVLLQRESMQIAPDTIRSLTELVLLLASNKCS